MIIYIAKDRMWRKNRAVYPESECIGVDLNRNFDDHFDGLGTSNQSCSDTYHGKKKIYQWFMNELLDDLTECLCSRVWKEIVNRIKLFYFERKKLNKTCAIINLLLPGPSPASEPETAATQAAIVEIASSAVALYSLHSYGQLWLYAFGYTEELPPEAAELVLGKIIQWVQC